MSSLLVAGTSSNAGKSVIVAALCRIFSKRGYSVAPFKAQNMSLNSYVTKNGKEIAIAQAFQAKAAGIEPNELMNPILLKPKGNFVSQLIVMGEAVKDVSSKEYYELVPKLKKTVEWAYNELSHEYNVIIEGAGGIAEINLYDRDLANIGIAKIAKPHIIIVGDIDRGGVFASLYGSYFLLPVDTANLVSGFIINRLRGRRDILNSGIEKLENLTGVKVLGVIPYAESAFSEDSLCIDEWNSEPDLKDKKVGILRLNKISNFTDFEPIRSVCKFVNGKYEELKELEVLIIPGSKNTILDLKRIKDRGFDENIKKFAKKKVVIGICGGYQMLGKELIDYGVEDSGKPKRCKGLGLLDVTTEFKDYKKTCVQVNRKVRGNAAILDKIAGEFVKGYEIHKGKTESSNPIFEDEFSGEGCASDDGLIWGTYMHGLFWNDNLIKALSSYLGVKFKVSSFEDRLNAFAKVVENSVDVDYIESLMF